MKKFAKFLLCFAPGILFFLALNRGIAGLNVIPFTEGQPDQISVGLKDALESSPEAWSLECVYGHSYSLRRQYRGHKLRLDISNYNPWELGYTKVEAWIDTTKLGHVHNVVRDVALGLFDQLRPAADAAFEAKNQEEIDAARKILSP